MSFRHQRRTGEAPTAVAELLESASVGLLREQPALGTAYTADLISEAMEQAILSFDVAHIAPSAEELAQAAVYLARPGPDLMAERLRRAKTLRTVIEGSDWLSAAEINRLQKAPPANKALPAADWKRRGRVFGVNIDGKDHFAAYQFDDLGQPLPVIAEVLKAFGEVADAWKLAAWFHYPNPWLVRHDDAGARNVAPKDALDRRAEVVAAAARRMATWVA